MLTTREMYILPAHDVDRFLSPRRRDAIALLLAVLPQIIHLRVFTAVNGRLTSYADFADIVLGIVLMIFIASGRGHIAASTGTMKTIRIVMSVALALLAVFYIATGSGLNIR